ncbi:AAEL002999-PA, partial [Aedes aegypti]
DVSVDGRPICVTLCDTAGQDALDPLRQLCYPGTDVFLLCFSVVQPESFRSLATKWAPEVSKLRGAVVLVGTQSDLRNDRSTALKLQIQGEKPVPVSAAWDFARKIGAKYIETSSHKKERIKETFDTAIWDVLQAREFNRKRPLWKRMLCLTC